MSKEEDLENHQLNNILKIIIQKIIQHSNQSKGNCIPDTLIQTISNSHKSIQLVRIMAYLVDKYLIIKTQPEQISLETPINLFSDIQQNNSQFQQNRQYIRLQEMLQKYQAQVRTHIRNQHTLKLHCDQLEQKLQGLLKENEKLQQVTINKQVGSTHRQNKNEGNRSSRGEGKGIISNKKKSKKTLSKAYEVNKETINISQEVDTYRNIRRPPSARKVKDDRENIERYKINVNPQQQLINRQMRIHSVKVNGSRQSINAKKNFKETRKNIISQNHH